MKAYVFPGQGAQFVGMGKDLYENSALAKDLFEKANIKLTWMDYSGYSEYNQLHTGFEHKVSILDLIFNTGPDSRGFMKF